MDDEVHALCRSDTNLKHLSRAIRSDQHRQIIEVKTRIGYR